MLQPNVTHSNLWQSGEGCKDLTKTHENVFFFLFNSETNYRKIDQWHCFSATNDWRWNHLRWTPEVYLTLCLDYSWQANKSRLFQLQQLKGSIRLHQDIWIKFHELGLPPLRADRGNTGALMSDYRTTVTANSVLRCVCLPLTGKSTYFFFLSPILPHILRRGHFVRPRWRGKWRSGHTEGVLSWMHNAAQPPTPRRLLSWEEAGCLWLRAKSIWKYHDVSLSLPQWKLKRSARWLITENWAGEEFRLIKKTALCSFNFVGNKITWLASKIKEWLYP